MKTKYVRRPKWVLWLLIVAFLFFMACDGTTMCIPSGDGPDSTPTPRPCSLVEHFDYPVGSLPPGWQLFNTPEVQVAVREYEGNKWLGFSLVEGKGYERFAIHGTLVCQCRQFTVKMKFLTNHDFGGGLIGYEGEGDQIRIALNPFQNKVLIQEHRGNNVPVEVEKTVTIDPGITYWLRIIPNYQAKSLEVQLSTDGSSFSQIAVASGFTKMEGKYGLITFGPNKPATVFDDLIVEGESSVPVVVPPTPTKPSEIKLVLDNEGLLISETDIWPEETVRVQFTVINQGSQPVKLQALLVVGRGPDGDKDIQDFDAVFDLTIAPGKSYTYGAKRSFTKLGRYIFVATYHPYDGGWPAVPTPKEGVPNRIETTVRKKTGIEIVGSARLQPYGLVIKNGDVEWAIEQIDWLEHLYSELPDTFYHLPSLGKFKRVHSLGENAAQYNWYNGWILVSDYAVSNPSLDALCHGYTHAKRVFAGYVVHELAHAIEATDLEKRQQVSWCTNKLVIDYARTADWQINPNHAHCGDETNFRGRKEDLPGFLPPDLCLDNSKKNALEDMAEAMRFYVMNSGRIQGERGSRSQARYDFLKNRIFKGKEYSVPWWERIFP